ncbi:MULTISPECIES: hypothetical protein [Paenibacillus]|uniref:Arylsulfotransferase ASST n=1 Tax=Paenibacillus pabuli TaxID=1472 RepID=A0A855Y0C3_9BACL|nr:MULTISPECIES: hypothetical protein [Paenibacillus]PWW32619.1 hypothetical protein DET56_1259 [Paenibacillus pabuli]PXV98283.1 hypothetical protein DEU73_12336 [Paenibacillus taichungensis]RAI83882.1 hypothetical protein DET54_1288 [Paenibacillus pabuli]
MRTNKARYTLILVSVAIISVGVVSFNLINRSLNPSSIQQPISNETNLTINEPVKAALPNLVQPYKLKDKSLISTFVAPSYINDALVAFERDVSEKSTSYIDIFSRKNKVVKNIYQTANKEIINSLVGVEDKLFWVEYGRDQEKDTIWAIKSLDMKNNQEKILYSGISGDHIESPVLRVYDNQVSWIEKKIKDHIVYSTAILYKPITNELIRLVTTELDERGNQRKGTFMALQRPTADGLLVQQSVFKTASDKSYEIVLYPYDHTKSITLLESNQGVVDFTADQEWFVWSEIGKISIADRKTGEIKYVFEAKDKDLTIDSPFIMNDHLYYRFSMYQIIDVDLLTGKTKELSIPRLSTSKIFNTGKYLGFSYMDAKNNTGEVEFNIISADQSK